MFGRRGVNKGRWDFQLRKMGMYPVRTTGPAVTNSPQVNTRPQVWVCTSSLCTFILRIGVEERVTGKFWWRWGMTHSEMFYMEASFLKEFDGLSVGGLGEILTVVVTGWAHWVTEGLYSLPAGHWMMYISPSLVHWMNLAASWGWG